MINKILDSHKQVSAYDKEFLIKILNEVGAILKEERIYRNARQKNAPNCGTLLTLLEEKEKAFLKAIEDLNKQSQQNQKQLFDE